MGSVAVTRELTSQILDHTPPYDLEAETGVLGSVLLMPEVCDEVSLVLRADDFYDDAHRRLFAHMQDMHDAGSKIDVTLLVDRLKAAGEFELIGGAAYLFKISQSVPNAAHARYYARIVREKATLRSLIEASTEILRDAYEAQREPKQLLSEAEQRIFSILDSRGIGRGVVDPRNPARSHGPAGCPDARRAHGRRRRERLRRSGPADRRSAQLGIDRPGGPAQHGQDRLCHEHRRVRGAGVAGTRPVRQPGNVGHRTGGPAALFGGPGQRS